MKPATRLDMLRWRVAVTLLGALNHVIPTYHINARNRAAKVAAWVLERILP